MNKYIINRRRFLKEVALGSVGASAITIPGLALLCARDFNESHASSGIAPGVRPGTGRIHTAEEAAGLAVALAKAAANDGTFGVGGLLIDRWGHIIAEAKNLVVYNGHLYDPSAHVERQLVDWYIARSSATEFEASTNKLTIVTSLDPCAMCAGAILRCGMRAIAVAEDGQAGIHTALQSCCLPQEVKLVAQEKLALFGIRGSRPQIGGINSDLFATAIPKKLAIEAKNVLLASVDKVRHTVGGLDAGGPVACKLAPDDLERVSRVAKQFGGSVRPVTTSMNVTRKVDRRDLSKYLDNDECVLVDQHGTVIIWSQADDNRGARTSVLELIRVYTALREACEREQVHLPHPRCCSIVKRHPPQNPATTLMELGAVGSFLEEPRLSSVLPAIGCISTENLALAQTIAECLPPLYRDIGVTLGLIAPED